MRDSNGILVFETGEKQIRQVENTDVITNKLLVVCFTIVHK